MKNYIYLINKNIDRIYVFIPTHSTYQTIKVIDHTGRILEESHPTSEVGNYLYRQLIAVGYYKYKPKATATKTIHFKTQLTEAEYANMNEDGFAAYL